MTSPTAEKGLYILDETLMTPMRGDGGRRIAAPPGGALPTPGRGDREGRLCAGRHAAGLGGPGRALWRASPHGAAGLPPSRRTGAGDGRARARHAGQRASASPIRIGRRVSMRANFGAAGIAVIERDAVGRSDRRARMRSCAAPETAGGHALWRLETLSLADGTPSARGCTGSKRRAFPASTACWPRPAPRSRRRSRPAASPDYVRLSTRLSARLADEREAIAAEDRAGGCGDGLGRHRRAARPDADPSRRQRLRRRAHGDGDRAFRGVKTVSQPSWSGSARPSTSSSAPPGLEDGDARPKASMTRG